MNNHIELQSASLWEDNYQPENVVKRGSLMNRVAFMIMFSSAATIAYIAYTNNGLLMAEVQGWLGQVQAFVSNRFGYRF